MDLASLITPGPDPLYKPKASYSPASAGSYFQSAPTSYSRTPQPPLSPPVDDVPKCSLPSISSLLEGADGAAMHAAKRQRTTPPLHGEAEIRTQAEAREFAPSGPQTNMPPTPPLRPGSGFHSNGHSPSASSVSAISTAIKTETYPQQPMALPSPTDRSSISSQGSVQQVPSAPYVSPAPSVASYSSPIEAPASSAMYYPRPASSGTYQSAPAQAAPLPPSSTQQMIPQVANAWQHHHYFPPSTAGAFQQNHDRYICRTCHKAFSRPSSLRIHSHSHTGEKPFRCTHAGCGKAFSVRSNMKRHERGCHTGRPVATAMV